MTPEYLIAQGRKLARPCMLLREHPNGDPVGMWWDNDPAELESTGLRYWMSFEFDAVPGAGARTTEIVSVITAARTLEGGRLALSPTWPKSGGHPLYAYRVEPIAPLEAVLGLGDSVVAEWLSSEAYEKESQAFFEIYTGIWQAEFPLYGENSDDVAVLGGWHFPWPDGQPPSLGPLEMGDLSN